MRENQRHGMTETIWQISLPLSAWLSAGGIALELCCFGGDGRSDGIGQVICNEFYFALWGVMAAVILGIRAYFDNRPTNVVMAFYAAVLTGWMLLFGGEAGRGHAVLIASGLGGVLLIRLMFREKLIRMLWGYGELALLIALELADIRFPRRIIVLAIILFLNSVSDTLSLLASSFDGGKVRSFPAVYAVIAAVTMFTPAPGEPYDWSFVIDAADAVQNLIEHTVYEAGYFVSNLGSDGVFRYGYTGYQDSSVSLLMSLEDQDKLQLYVWGSRTRRNLYLRGTVCDSYTDGMWETSGGEETMDYRTDTLMTLYSIFSSTQDKAALDRFMEVKEQEILLRGIRTKSLFFPIKLLDTNREEIDTEGDNLRAGERSAEGDRYSYLFLDLDYASPELIEILSRGGEPEYSEEAYEMIYDRMKEYYGVELEKMPFDEFQRAVSEGKERIAVRYTETGSAVSKEVRALAEEITEECGSDYEKCKALSEYLYRYSYNKAVKAPGNANVLDWFLFESREGYCIHYATALVMMLRCEGIPARLAEGFLVDYEDSEPVNGFPVSDKDAHVWAEAYLDGFGWVRLEPTVVNAKAADSVWHDEDDKVQNEAEQGGTAQDEANGNEDLEFPAEFWEEDETDKTEENGGGTLWGGAGAAYETAGKIWRLTSGMLLGLGVSIVLIVAVQFIYRKIYIRKSADLDVLLPYFLTLLGKRYSPRRAEETMREYFDRIIRENRIPDADREQMARILKISEEYWYDAGKADEEDIRTVRAVCDIFRKKDLDRRAARIRRS